MTRVIGKGTLHGSLSRQDIVEICASALADVPFDGKRVLVLIPDHTRHAPIDLFFDVLAELLYARVRALDYLVATGTHAPMRPDQLYRHLGITATEHRQRYLKTQLFNHDHLNPMELVELGRIAGATLARLTGGLCQNDVLVTINRKATEYDHIIVVSPVVPHEAMGFAGGNKYFFPGIAGLALIEAFHWVAALITNPIINGVKDTPTRRIIDHAATMLPTERTNLAFVVNADHDIACLFAGDPEPAWSNAVDYSAQLHIKFLERPLKRVLALTPAIYEELWVAGKAMYKLEPIVADGGELIIYGPHIRELGFVHGRDLLRIGYHVRDYFTQQWDRFANESKLMLAHSTNVKGIGSYCDGIEAPRVKVTLATGISEAICKHVNLAYSNPALIEPHQFEQDEATLVVHEAGQVLYRLKAVNAFQ